MLFIVKLQLNELLHTIIFINIYGKLFWENGVIAPKIKQLTHSNINAKQV